MEVGGDVGECQVETARDDDFRCIAVFAGAHECRIVDCAFDDFVWTRFEANEANVVFDGWLS